MHQRSSYTKPFKVRSFGNAYKPGLISSVPISQGINTNVLRMWIPPTGILWKFRCNLSTRSQIFKISGGMLAY
jgi:hypothetical protein